MQEQSKEQVVIVSALRTPFSKFGGALKDVPCIDLGVLIVKELLSRTGIKGDQIDELYLGTCVPAESGLVASVIARQVLLKAGLPETLPSMTIDRACCSSSAAVEMGWRAIRVGDAEIVMAIGVENLSRTPYLNRSLRWGQRLGNVVLEDPLFELGYKGFNPVAVDAGEVALEHDVGREEQDKWAFASQQKYAKAAKAGKFKDEIIPVPVKLGKGKEMVFEADDFPKPDTTIEKLSKLPTVYGSPTVTPGNAPGLDAGAAGLLLMSANRAKQMGLEPLATVINVASVATSPREIATVPAYAIKKSLSEAGINLDEIDLIEINEAFAAMPLVSSKILADGDGQKTKKIREKINVNGGAIAIGHPVGASGARILTTLIYELKRRGGGLGIAAICGGLAQGDAMLIRCS